MKNIFIIYAMLFGLFANAQCIIPNGGFDNWKIFNKTDGSGQYEYPENWYENFGNPTSGRWGYGIGFFYKYSGTDANGSALLLKRNASNKQNGFVRFECKTKPTKLKGRYKFFGSDNISETDTLTIGIHFSMNTDTLTLAQLYQASFKENTSMFKTTDIQNDFTEFEINLSNSLATDEIEYITIQLIISAGNYINGSTATAVIDDLNLIYPTKINITETACGSYISPSGKTFNTSGTFADTLWGENTDTIYTIHLTVNNFEAELENKSGTLTANIPDASYQWLNCTTGSTIQEEQSQNFVVGDPGSYAVVIDNGVCIDTSNCLTVSATNITHSVNKNKLHIYPNPATNYVHFESDAELQKAVLCNPAGSLLISIKDKNSIDISKLPKGLYLLQLYFVDRSLTTTYILIE